MMRRIGFLVLALMLCVPAGARAQFFEPVLFSYLRQFLEEPEVSSEGSPQIRYWVNVWTMRDGVQRLTNRERDRMIKTGELVFLDAVPDLDIAKTLESSKRYLYRWAADMLREIAAFYRADTGRALPMNSALRTIEQQQALLLRREKVGGKWRWVGNPNAIPAEGLLGSAHPYANTVDLARLRIPDRYEAEFEAKLLALEEKRCLDVTKESGQAVFHVTFFKSCAPAAVAAAHGGK